MEEEDRSTSEIEAKIAKIETLKTALAKESATSSNSGSLDEQLHKAEIEYELMREEVELMSLQEGHCDVAEKRWSRVMSPSTMEISSDFYSFINTLKSSGLVPAVETLELSELDTKVQLVFHDISGSKCAAPFTAAVVAWAEDGVGLRAGDRILEVCGYPVSELTQEKYADLLYSTTPPHHIVFVRPTTKYQMLRSVAGKESASLRQELASVLHRLNQESQDNKDLKKHIIRLKSKSEEVEKINNNLRQQLVSLQNGILFLCQMIGERINEWQVNDSEKKHMMSCWLPLLLSFFSPNNSEFDQTIIHPPQESFLNLETLNSCEFPWERLPLLCPECQSVVGELPNWKMRSSPKHSDAGSVDSGTCDS